MGSVTGSPDESFSFASSAVVPLSTIFPVSTALSVIRDGEEAFSSFTTVFPLNSSTAIFKSSGQIPSLTSTETCSSSLNTISITCSRGIKVNHDLLSCLTSALLTEASPSTMRSTSLDTNVKKHCPCLVCYLDRHCYR